MRLGWEHWYVLDEERRPVRCADIEAWSRWWSANDAARHVARDEVEEWLVSTVFLGINHRWHGKGPPLVFETMVFDPDGHGADTYRYSTWDDAEAGHQAAVARLRERVA